MLSAAEAAGSAALADDAAKPFLSSVRQRASSVASGIGSGKRLARNKLNARFFARLPKGSGNQGYVYLMDDVTTPGRFKIGKTIQPETRLKQVQYKLSKSGGGKVDFSCIVSADDMKHLEDALRSQFKPQNLPDFGAGKEWFMLNAAQVAAACSHQGMPRAILPRPD